MAFERRETESTEHTLHRRAAHGVKKETKRKPLLINLHELWTLEKEKQKSKSFFLSIDRKKIHFNRPIDRINN